MSKKYLDKEMPTVLIVEDDRIIAESLSIVLKSHDLDVIIAKNGKDALKILEVDLLVDKRINLVSLDILMPVMDGIEVLKKVKKMAPDLSVIMLTALGEASFIDKVMESGCDGYFTKPLDPNEYATSIKNLIQNKKELREIEDQKIEVGYLKENIRRLVKEKIEWENKSHLLEQKLNSLNLVEEIFEAKEEDTEFLKQVGELVRPIVHELKNNLESIDFTISKVMKLFMENKEIDLNTVKNLISKSSNYFKSIKRRLDDLSYLGGKQPHFSEVNLNEIVSDNIEMLRLRDDRYDIEYDISNEKIMIQADKESLNQIISNLLINAVDACEPDRGRIEITVKEIEGYVEITVTDNGIGIYKRELDKIFNLHYTTKKTGFGVGLYLVKKAVELHGGRIKVESSSGAKTTFTVTLPIKQEGRDGNNTQDSFS
ncbi:MAG: response regulator [Nitrospirae bacterium]|nr:response regulator [Nitrospirota bacterium]